MSAQSAQIKIPDKLAPIFKRPRGQVRYRGAFGGRGSAKSFTFAKMAALFGYAEPLRILCTREYQNSIRESFHAELANAINSEPWMMSFYEIGESFISGANGTEFIFKGLRHNISSIKSMAQIDLCIVEEAEDVPESSWVALTPTIRAEQSEIWVIWNPRLKNSPVDTRFRQNQDDDMLIAELNYPDNPWFPTVLEKERQRDQRNCDPSVYAHIWEGAYLEITDAQILKGKVKIQEFIPSLSWDGPYFGADWGFSIDPTGLIKSWIYDDCLYIEHEAYGVGVEIDETPDLFRSIPGSEKHVIRADNARPETISYMRRAGFNVRPAQKGKGSVEDGIAFLRGFKAIVVHPRCKHFINESRLYSYKTDRLSGDVLPIIIDNNNHLIDALRYALEPVMHRGLHRQDITTPDNPSISAW